MEFLVKMEVLLPAEIASARRDDIYAAEKARGLELARAGKLHRLWRIPGTAASWSVWRVEDPTELHDLLSQLPLRPWLRLLECHALAVHPNDPG